jgi:predicted phage-related endonuclease
VGEVEHTAGVADPVTADGDPGADEAAFHAERLSGVGGSDAHHLGSMEPWGCERRLAYEKRGTPRDFPDRELARILARGKRLEAIAAELYTEATGRTLYRIGVRRVEEAPYLLVHPDRRLQAIDERGPGIWEAKVPGEWAFKKYEIAGLPPAYILQVQWALMVTGYQWGAFCLFWADGWQLLRFDVERNDALCTELEARGHAFWRQVENGPLPDQLPTDDPRCGKCGWRFTCLGPAAERLSTKKDADAEIVELKDPELERMVDDYVDAREIATQSADVVDAIKEQIKGKLADVRAADVGGHRVYYKQQKDSVFIDEKAVKTGKPKFVAWMYDRFGKVKKGARPLQIY